MRTLRLVAVWLCSLALLISCARSSRAGESYIVYTTSEWPRSQIRFMKSDGSEAHILLENKDVDFYDPLPSPDGTRIHSKMGKYASL